MQVGGRRRLWDARREAVITTRGPVELKVLIRPESPVEAQRALFCAFYDACLDEAVARSWTSWTCARCSLFAVRARAAQPAH
jgi:hypothetical protein